MIPGRIPERPVTASRQFGRSTPTHWIVTDTPAIFRAGAAEPGADAAGGDLGRGSGGCQGAGEAELGVGGDDEPGPAVGGGGVAEQGACSSRDFLVSTRSVAMQVAAGRAQDRDALQGIPAHPCHRPLN
jgi:hypothetical protein